MEKIIFRQYRDPDKDGVWRLYVNGLNQTGKFVFSPGLDPDFKDIKGVRMGKYPKLINRVKFWAYSKKYVDEKSFSGGLYHNN